MKEYIIDVPFALKLAAQVGHGATAVVLPCMRCLFPHSSHIRAALHVRLHQLPGTAPLTLLHASAWLLQSHRLYVSPSSAAGQANSCWRSPCALSCGQPCIIAPIWC